MTWQVFSFAHSPVLLRWISCSFCFQTDPIPVNAPSRFFGFCFYTDIGFLCLVWSSLRCFPGFGQANRSVKLVFSGCDQICSLYLHHIFVRNLGFSSSFYRNVLWSSVDLAISERKHHLILVEYPCRIMKSSNSNLRGSIDSLLEVSSIIWFGRFKVSSIFFMKSASRV